MFFFTRLHELEVKVSNLQDDRVAMKKEIRQLNCPHYVTNLTVNNFHEIGYGNEKCESCSKTIVILYTRETYHTAQLKAATLTLKKLKEIK